jgi:acyl-coenzyme A thioesterase PaaI-like protein
MTDPAIEKMTALGWSLVETSGFINLVGPLWQRTVGGNYEYALLTENKHHNRRHVVQGGVVMTLADRTCGMTARFVTGRPNMATVQFDTHFVDAAKIGEIMISRPRVVRGTRSLIFMHTEIHVDDRCIATASGLFKVLAE